MPGGVTATSVVLFSTANAAVAPSKVTAVVDARSVPLTVTEVPPDVEPEAGVSETSVGAST